MMINLEKNLLFELPLQNLRNNCTGLEKHLQIWTSLRQDKRDRHINNTSVMKENP